eukprot:478460-Prorocentrum_minimum.AAC.2
MLWSMIHIPGYISCARTPPSVCPPHALHILLEVPLNEPLRLKQTGENGCQGLNGGRIQLFSGKTACSGLNGGRIQLFSGKTACSGFAVRVDP